MMEDSIIRHKFKNGFLKNVTRKINELIYHFTEDKELCLEGMNQIFIDYVQIPFNRQAMKRTLKDLYCDYFTSIPHTKNQHALDVQKAKIKHNNKALEQLSIKAIPDIDNYLNQTLEQVHEDYIHSQYKDQLAKISSDYATSRRSQEYIEKFDKLAKSFVHYFAYEGVANEKRAEAKISKTKKKFQAVKNNLFEK